MPNYKMVGGLNKVGLQAEMIEKKYSNEMDDIEFLETFTIHGFYVKGLQVYRDRYNYGSFKQTLVLCGEDLSIKIPITGINFKAYAEAVLAIEQDAIRRGLVLPDRLETIVYESTKHRLVLYSLLINRGKGLTIEKHGQDPFLPELTLITHEDKGATIEVVPPDIKHLPLAHIKRLIAGYQDAARAINYLQPFVQRAEAEPISERVIN